MFKENFPEESKHLDDGFRNIWLQQPGFRREQAFYVRHGPWLVYEHEIPRCLYIKVSKISPFNVKPFQANQWRRTEYRYIWNITHLWNCVLCSRYKNVLCLPTIANTTSSNINASVSSFSGPDECKTWTQEVSGTHNHQHVGKSKVQMQAINVLGV